MHPVSRTVCSCLSKGGTATQFLGYGRVNRIPASRTKKRGIFGEIVLKIYDQRGLQMRVFVSSGADVDKAFDFNTEVISVGRSSNNDIQLNDQFASHNHLKMYRKDDKWYLQDLNSRNGTFVNGERVTAGEQFEVSEGLSIVVGMSVLSLGRELSDGILSSLAADSSLPRREASQRSHAERKKTGQKNMDLVYKVYNVLSESLEINEKLAKALDFIFDLLLRIDHGTIILLECETGELEEVASKCSKGANGPKYSTEVVNWVLRHKEVFVVCDADMMGGEVMPETLRLRSIKSVMCVPLICRSRVKGVIYVDSVSRPYGFRGEDIYLMRALSGPIAMAIENASLAEKNTPQEQA
jgi:pSer/pThr/pTyr-binding forkhead associated (FHA) protein